MKRKGTATLALGVALAFLLTACNGGAGVGEVQKPTDITAAFQNTDSIDLGFTDRDRSGAYETAGATRVTFADSGATVDGGGAVAEGAAVRITAAGTYLLAGSAANGSVTVEAGETDKVQLVLCGLSLTASDCPALYIRAADKVFLTLAEGTVNSLSDGAAYTYTDGDSTPDGVIFSRADLTVNGAGALTVNALAKHGLVSKDDLVITGGILTVDAPNVALCGKDCVKIAGGEITLTAGTDGIRSDNTEEAHRGFVYIAGGDITVTAESDGIQAETLLKVAGGTLSLKTGGGSANGSTHTDGGFNQNWGFGGHYDSTSTTDDGSAKGLKCAADLRVEGGQITVVSADDCLHAGGSILLADGVLSLASGDDGVHADNALGITGGRVTVTKSYEGLEATDIVVSGGHISVVASDDGLNAAGGNDGSAMGGRPGQGNFEAINGSLSITGGYLLVNAAGDGLDSNGHLTVTGGITLVSGPTNSGNGALDYAGTASVCGGVVIALGAAGMATGFTAAENQGAIFLSSLSQQVGGSALTILDENGRALASFTPDKAYSSAVITAPGISEGKTYKILVGATVEGADENGYAQNASVTGGRAIAEVEMTSLLFGTSGMGGPGGGMFPGGGGPGGRPR